MISTSFLRSIGAELVLIPENGILTREGEVCHYYYQLVSGSVKWTNITPGGREIIQEMIIPGEPVASFTLFDGLPSVATAVAMENSEVLRLPKIEFETLLRTHPELYQLFTQYFVRRLRYQFMALKEFTNTKPIHRMRTLFEYFKVSGRSYCSHCSKVKLTRQQISFMTGLRIETVIRTIRSMATAKEVFIVRGKLYLEDSSTELLSCSHPKLNLPVEFVAMEHVSVA